MWMKCLFLALLTQCLALQQDCAQVGRKAKNLTVQLQVSQSSEFDFSGYIPAVEVALDLINNNSSLLCDYHISFTDVVDPQVRRKQFSVCTDLTYCKYSCSSLTDGAVCLLKHITCAHMLKKKQKNFMIKRRYHSYSFHVKPKSTFSVFKTRWTHCQPANC